MSFFDRACVNDALDALLDRENGKGETEEAETEAREEKIDEEARRAARLSFDGWRDGARPGDEPDED